MNKFRFTLKVCAIAIFTLALASLAQAQATRTWVSGVGDDVNPCSRTAPCKTFAGAISKTAVNGEIDCLDEGGFGTVTITKGITIDGTYGGGFGSILATGASQGVLVNISAPVAADNQTVILRNLFINGTGGINGAQSSATFGVKILAAALVSIEDCQIFGMTKTGGRGITDDRVSAGKGLFVSNTRIENSGQFGIAISGGVTQGVLDGVTIKNSVTANLLLAGGCKVTVRNSTFFGNSAASGVDIANGSIGDFENTMIAYNNTGLLVESGSTARISNVSLVQNTKGLDNQGTTRSFGNNKIDGNTNANTGNAIQGPGSGGPSQQ